MLIFLKRLIIFSIFLPPAHLMDYALKRADINTGAIVFEKNVRLSKIADGLYKITSSEGEITAGITDFLTMIGQMVELITLNPNLNVRCLFNDLTTAQNFYRDLKPNVLQSSTVEDTAVYDPTSTETPAEFPIFTTAIIVIKNIDDKPTEEISRIIMRGKIVVEKLGRFHIIPEGYQTADMIFSCKHFNISKVLRYGRILLVVRLYDTIAREFILMRFVLSFSTYGPARRFFNYVIQMPDCTDDSIPLDVPIDLSTTRWK